jgi:hypothetical protein
MLYQGHVENGEIRLANSVVLPEGAEVQIEVVAPAPANEPGKRGLSLYDRLRPVVGAVKDLPPDASMNLDHYLYGLPKKQ